MADLADVEAALVDLAASALYPDSPSAASVVGVDCRVYRGWPNPVALDSDLRAGKVNVTVFPEAGSGQTLTRYDAVWRECAGTPALSCSIRGEQITFDGLAEPGQLAGISVHGRSFVSRTVAGDTTAMVAANLAALIRMAHAVQLSGNSLFVPGATAIVARVAADGSAIQEVRRQSHGFRISCWCPSPVIRDAAAAAIDCRYARLAFIDLPDGSRGRLVYRNSAVFDQSQNATLYRRDLIYEVEYPTLVTERSPAMLFGTLGLNSAQADT